MASGLDWTPMAGRENGSEMGFNGNEETSHVFFVQGQD